MTYKTRPERLRQFFELEWTSGLPKSLVVDLKAKRDVTHPWLVVVAIFVATNSVLPDSSGLGLRAKQIINGARDEVPGFVILNAPARADRY